MMNNKEAGAEGLARLGAGAMHKRRATLEDGRYLIYYTFGDEPGAQAGEGGNPKPEAVPEAAEEPRV